MSFVARLALLSGLAAAGCQTTVVTQGSQQAAQAQAGSAAPQQAATRVVVMNPCSPPRGSGPFTRAPNPVNHVQVHWSPRAVAANQPGCAGVKFRIGADGVQRDVEVLAEYPIGYGFGASVADAVKSARWAPTDDLAWHYLDLTVRPKPAT